MSTMKLQTDDRVTVVVGHGCAAISGTVLRTDDVAWLILRGGPSVDRIGLYRIRWENILYLRHEGREEL